MVEEIDRGPDCREWRLKTVNHQERIKPGDLVRDICVQLSIYFEEAH